MTTHQPYTPIYSTAPIPAALRSSLRRAHLRRRLSPFMLALAFVLGLVALLSGLYWLLVPAALCAYLGVRWSGEPLRAFIHTGPLGWL